MKRNYNSIKEYCLTVKESSGSFESKKITMSQDAADFAQQFYFDDIEIFESFFVIALNRGNLTQGWMKISQGGIAGTAVDVRLIAKFAIDMLASSVILVHNHPSGQLKFSSADIKITQKVKQGLLLLDIQVLDHIVLAKNDNVISHISMADDNLII